MVAVNGAELYVEIHGAEDAPPVLFIHGHGGGFHYVKYQAGLLSQDLRLIAPDQRGVLRSSALPPGGPLDVPLLLADFEALRQHLGIDRWAIIAHSAGGHYAVDYAINHPASVNAVVFDCPCWDFDVSDRYRLPLFGRLYDELGDSERAERCRMLASSPRPLTADDRTYELAFGLGERFLELSFHDRRDARAFQRVGEQADFPPELWERGSSHGALLPVLYDSRLKRLKELTQPSLLIHGVDDLAAPPMAIDAYRANVPDGRIATFHRSGHFPHAEEPARYAEVVRAFVTEHAS
ncbi:alpha/beta fold hydrolase [Actinopolymorpha alba]|uniref:alpha/beta fold hydrolase n=1 Tax=Actinopolymorpha alba TaxID=533267 RepID=UPI00035E9BCF|nr:alpha/beta hydrolase [Actinopolymorpha alba]